MSSIISFKRGLAAGRQSLVLLCALLASAPLQAAPERVLQAIDFNTLPGDRVAVVMTLSSAAPEPQVFATENPARVAIDLPQTGNALPSRLQRINVGNARSIAVAETADRTRVVIELNKLSTYNVQVEGNRVLVELDSAAAAAATVPTIGTSQQGARVDNIDFRRGEQGEGRIIISLSDPSVNVDVREEAGRIIADFKGTGVDDALLQRLDVLDFATPVKFIDTSREGINTRVMVTPTASTPFEQVAYQTGSTFTIELQPLTSDEQERRARLEPTYTGERITLNFQDVDVRAILQIIADVAGKNLVASDAVSGTIALRLENVPWDQALDIILTTKGLDKREDGNVMLVGTIKEIAARETAEAAARTLSTELAPLRSEVIQVNYAKAQELATLISSSENLLSGRGTINFDARTNTLLINETREKLADIRALVSQLDVPVKQVLIESRIVIANDDFSRDIGVRAGISTVQTSNDNVFVSSGTTNAVNGVTNAILSGQGSNLGGSFGSNLNRFNINLPVSDSTASRIALGILGSDYLVDLELSALQAEGRGELISTPRVITANAQEANIKQGVEIPYQQASSSGATNVAFKEAVLSLNVTPQLTPDNRVIMDLVVSKDEPDFTRAVLGVPPVNTREVKTRVLVRNGETVVLGGVYERNIQLSETKVPILGDIPLVGYLFRSRSKSDSKTELLIFVTPKIISEGISLN